MASRVNTKFVVILAGVLVVFGGLVMYVGVSAIRKSGDDYIRKGDAAMAEGDYKKASNFYGTAFNHDRSRTDWLDKWVGALESWTPSTRTEYIAQFSQTYMPVMKTVAHTKREDIAAHDKYLGLMLEQMRRVPYSRGSAERLITETDASLTFFSYAPEDQTDWWRLRRYRGMARSTIVAEGGTLDASDRKEMMDDLEAALEADPGDALAAQGIMQIHNRAAYDARVSKRYEEMKRARAEAHAVIDSFLADNPGHPDGMLTLLGLEIDEAREQAFVEAERRSVRPRMPDLSGFAPRLDEIASRIRSVGETDDRVLARFRSMEAMVDPEGNLSRSEALVNEALAREPSDSRLLYATAEINLAQGDIKEELDLLGRLHALTMIPISLEGVFQFYYQEQALVMETRAHLFERGNLEDTPANKAARDRALASAKEARRRFAQQVPETDARLTLLDGLIANAEGDTRTAMSKFQQYNVQRTFRDIEGLWQEAQAAAGLDRLGVARERLEQILEMQPENNAAVLMLGQVQMNLADYPQAEALFARVLEVDPTNELAQRGILQARIAQGSEQSGDPVRDALVEAARIREGTARDAGDPKRAIDFLLAKFEELEYHPRVAREIAATQLGQGDMVAARATIDQSIQANPGDESLTRLRTALNASDPTDVSVALIKESGASELDKLLTIHSLYRRVERTAEADQVLDRLTEIAPENPGVLDLRLVRALREKKDAEAMEIVDAAVRTNADLADGLTFRSRLEASRGNNEEAMRALEQAIRGGAQDSTVYRLLAMHKIAVGDLDGAVKVYEDALNVRPDDLATIIGYLRTLVTANDIPKALQRARSMELYGRRSSEFMDLWLRLEAVAGGPNGVTFAIDRRERMLELDPSDRPNRVELARLYVLGKRFADARVLLDTLRREQDDLQLVELDARWHADQVTVQTPEGARDGVTMAREVYSRFLVGLHPDEMAPAYVSMAQFMLNRGRPQVAIEALKEASELQDPQLRQADKMLGEVYAAVQEWELALDMYRSIIASGLDDVQQNYQKRVVEALLRLYRYDEAGQELKKIERLASIDVTVRLQQAEVAMGNGDRAEALRLLNQAVNEAPNQPLVFIQRARLRSEDLSQADDVLADLNQALRLNPNDWRTLRVRAAFYYQLKRDEDAIKDLKAALRLNPSLDDVLFSLVSELVDKGRSGEASSLADEVIEARLGDTQLTTQVATMFTEKGEWDRAVNFYRKSWDKSGSNAVAMRLIDSMLRTKPAQVRDAREVFNAVAIATPDASNDPGIQATRAIIEFTQGMRQEAEARMAEAYDKAFDDVNEVNTWAANVGRMYLHEPSQAILTFMGRVAAGKAPGTPARDWLEFFIAQQMLTEDQTRAEGLSRLTSIRDTTKVAQIPRLAYRLTGRVHYTEENFDEAASVWREGLSKYPGDWEMLNNLGYVVSEKQGDPDAGLALVEESLEVSPDNPQALDTRAAILVTLGRHGEARATLDRALRIARDLDTRVSLWLRLARVHLALGSAPQAGALLDQIKANVNVSPRRMERFESDISALEAEIDSARGG